VGKGKSHLATDLLAHKRKNARQVGESSEAVLEVSPRHRGIISTSAANAVQ